MSTPSSRKLLASSRLPLTYGRPPPVVRRPSVNPAGLTVVAPGVDRGQLHEIAAVERQVDVGGAADDRADLGGFGLEQDGGAGDLDGFGHHPNSIFTSSRARAFISSTMSRCTAVRKPEASNR